MLIGIASPLAAVPSNQQLALTTLAADPQIHVPGFDVDSFRNPTDQKPAVLWFWDRMQTEAQIDARLESMHAAGFTETVIFRWFGDAPEAYFSDAWFTRVEHLLSKSRELGMSVWLDNDDKFPSGSASGLIVHGGTVGSKNYAPRPDLGVKYLATAGSAIRTGGTDVQLHDLFGSNIQFDDGQIVADTNSAPGITVLANTSDWADYSLKSRFRIDRDTAGFMVRSTDKLNGYLVDVRADGKVDVWRQQNGGFSTLRIGSMTRPGWDAAASHDVQITLNGSNIGISLDGVDEPALTDSTFATGGAGMRVAGNQAWRLDELSVSALPSGALLYSNDYSDEASVADFDTETRTLDNIASISARPAGGEGANDPGQVIDITDQYSADGRWSAPAGQWRIDAYRFELRGGDREAYADTMDLEAQHLFNQIILDEYFERFGGYFGNTFKGFADDESEVGRHGDDLVPWTPAIKERLKNSGLNAAAVIASVFKDFGEAGTQLKGKYYQAVSNQWVDAYWKTKYQWAQDHGVSIISNPLYDEYGPAGRLHETGNLLTLHQWAQVPGTDLISEQVHQGYARNLPYEPASVAHQLGRPLVYDELVGAAGWETPLSEVRESTAMSAVRGINKALYHATFDAPETGPFPPTFSDNNVWWKFMPQVTEWTGRLMEFGRHKTAAQTAVIQMQRSAEAVQLKDQSRVDDPFFAVEHALEDNQVDFDLLDEGALSHDPQILAQAKVTKDGRLKVGQMSYSAVVVPAAPYFSLEAALTLQKFVEAGGELVFAGAPPEKEIEGRDAELASTITAITSAGGGRVVMTTDPSEAGAAAAGLGQAAVDLADDSPHVRVLRFQEGKTSGYLLLNEGQSDLTTNVTFPAAGVPVKWDPETGAVAELATYSAGSSSTVAPLTLLPDVPVGITISPQLHSSPHALQSVGPGTVERVDTDAGAASVTVRSFEGGTTAVQASDGASTYAALVSSPELPAEIPLSGDWTMQLGNGSSAEDRPLKSWTDIAPTYSGTTAYKREINLSPDQVKSDWQLDLGRVANAAEVTVNGEKIGDRIWAPYRIDLGDALVEGTNIIEIAVTNTDANSRNDIRESGLLGPVVLRPYSLTESPLTPSNLEITAGNSVMDVSGEISTVILTVENPRDTAVTGGAIITGPSGWRAGPASTMTIPAGGAATIGARIYPTAFIPAGEVQPNASMVVDGEVAASRSLAGRILRDTPSIIQ